MSARNSSNRATSLAKALIACACAVALGHASAQQPAKPSASPASQASVAVTGASPRLAAATSSAAEPLTVPISPMSAGTAAEIQKINEEMAVLQARLNELELRAKIAAKQKEINGAAGDGGSQSSFDKKSGMPSVVSVAGLRGNLEALLVFPGGVTQRVRTGDVIDDRRVAKVAINEVVLTDLKGRNIQRLAFGSSPMTKENVPLPPAGSPASPFAGFSGSLPLPGQR